MTAAKSTTTKTTAAKPKPKPADEPTDLSVPFRGLTVKVPAAALDDFELIADLSRLERDGDPSVLPSILDRLVGDQYAAVLDTARDKKTGRVTIGAGADLVRDLLDALDPN